MLPALWKQRLDRETARATHPPADAMADERQAAPTARDHSFGPPSSRIFARTESSFDAGV